MIIRKATPSDINDVMEIFSRAREFMRSAGNNEQWSNGYPSREVIENDQQSGCSYVVVDNGEIIGTFFFKIGIDPTYVKIYDGEWISDEEYGVIHRIAVKYHGRNIASFVYNYCFERVKSLRIDTHRDNIPMQKSLMKNGFVYCGIILLASGDERLAYQRI